MLHLPPAGSGKRLVGQAILPATAFQAVRSGQPQFDKRLTLDKRRLKVGGSQDWLPHLVCGVFLLASALWAGDPAETHHVTAVRFWSLGDVTRIAVETDGQFVLHSDRLDN